MTVERRLAERYPAVVEIAIDETPGVIRNLSPVGLYFETPTPLSVDQQVSISVSLERAGPARARVSCRARIVRVELRGDVYGAGAAYEVVAFDVL